MANPAMTDPSRYVLGFIAIVAYFGRPWSCGVVLSKIPREGSPHSMFDYHGMGLVLAWATALMLSPLAWMLIKRGSERRPAISGLNASSVGVALIVVLFLGTPMLSQFAYLGLPLALSWPVLASSIAWLAIASYLAVAAAAGGPE